MAAENVVQRDIWIGLSREFGCALFRTNSGKAFLSNLGPAGVTWHNDGSVTIAAARMLPLGLALMQGETAPGLADLNGRTTVTITKEMVGRKVAVFTSIEAKRTTGGKRMKDQREYLQNVSASGGIAGFATCLEDARKIILAWLAGERPPAL